MSSQGSSQGSSRHNQGSQRQSEDDQLKELLHPIRDLTKNFDIDLSEILRNYMEGVEVEETSLNFAHAALVLQGSASVFGKKVEYLYNLVYQLLQRLHNDKKSGVSKTTKERDVMLAGRHINNEFMTLWEFSFRINVDLLALLFGSAIGKHGLLKVNATPLSLIPLDDHEKGDINLKTVDGEVIGNKRDYQLNVSPADIFGCMFLLMLYFDLSPEDAVDVSSNSFSPVPDGCDNDNDSVEGNDIVPAEVNDIVSDEFNDIFPVLPVEVNDIIPMEIDTVLPAQNPLASCNDIGGDDMHEEDMHVDFSADVQTQSPVPVNDSKIADVGNSVTPGRRSLRQAEKVKKKAKETEPVPEVNPWAIPTETEQIDDLKLPLVIKKPPRRAPKSRKSTKLKAGMTIDNFVDLNGDDGTTATDFAVVCPVDSKALKRLALNALTDVNTAFEQVASDCCKNEEDIIQKLRKKLALKMNIPPDDGVGGLEDSDNDDIDAGDLPISNNDCCSPDSGCMPNTPPKDLGEQFQEYEEVVSFDGMLQAHVAHYMKDTEKYSETTDLSERVKAWEEKIKPVIEEENEREVFNIHLYGSRIIDHFEDNNRKQSLRFASICNGKSRWEVCRYFLASLILANNNNVEISTEDTPSGMHDVNLTLLTRKRHQEQLDAFGHSSGEHDT